MKYRGFNGNIYSSDSFDPEFIAHLYSLPAEFLEELFMSWVMVKNNQNSIPVIDIDAIHRKPDNGISNKEIKDFYVYLKSNKIDITKINKGGKNK